MVDLSGVQQGNIGPGLWFSELFVSVVRSQLTGGILIKTEQGDAAVFTREGNPVHVTGTAFQADFIGQILQEMDACRPEHLQASIEAQSTTQPPSLLGSILMRTAEIPPDTVKKAIQTQNQRRLQQLFALQKGDWQSAPGENDRIREIGVEAAPWPIFFTGLQKNATDLELRIFSESLLGKAVQRPSEYALPALELGSDEKRLLQYLAKPRRLDQLERALGRRKVRGFLRGLELLGQLVFHPVAKAIVIPKASLLKPNALPGATEARAAAKRRASSRSQPPPGAPTPESTSASTMTSARARPRRQSSSALWKVHPLVREVEMLHSNMAQKTHFDMLGATEQTSKEVLRKTFTNLAKKYHPDALPQGVPKLIAQKAQELTARLNDAYRTLTHDDSRKTYIEMLQDKRIRGDSQRADIVKDAETKAVMGSVFLKKKEYEKAREVFKVAMKNDPETPSYKAHYAWAIFADPKIDREQAVRTALPLLKEALQQEGANAEIHYYVGQIYKSTERTREAIFHFKKAAGLNPKHTEAVREVRLVEMRENKAEARTKTKAKERGTSTLTRLFKKE